ncbi:MAG: YggS family pyridoxal phosphate-dependent enzyme [Acidimicrobiales bacterium]|nr:YggS family pyridoxal phosphate-dependent enzyme [Acidimicrobiales bacterium]
MSPDANEIKQSFGKIKERIRQTGRDLDSITFVGVTKGFDAHTVEQALQAGITNFGENYSSEFVQKAKLVTGPATWHFIGTIQRRNIASMARYVSLWQSIVRIEEARDIANIEPGAKGLVQIDLAELPNRSGVKVEDLSKFMDLISKIDISIRGFMCMGDPFDMTRTREIFTKAHEISEDFGLPELSMGMSDDLEVALECGSTIVRIGSALLGQRA